ncbi:MAG: hypothetical protein WCA10_26115 [Terracidiphilus sp.]
MSPFACTREREVTELLHQGYWPEACPEELRAHVETCRSCSDLVLVSQAMQASRRQTLDIPRLESPGALWWRAQLRRRNAAIERVGRPILGAQIFALTLLIVVGAGGLVWKGNLLRAWLENLPQALHLEALVPAALSQSGGLGWIVPALATVALLSGVVVYLATEKQ